MMSDALAVKANAGDAGAQFLMGLRYLQGDGVLQDYAVAMDWFLAASEQNQAGAQFNIGSIYLQGCGVEKDPPRAFEWFQKAARNAERDLLYNIAQMVESHQNFLHEDAWPFAVRCYCMAADAGLAEAQMVIGVRLFTGEGVNENRERGVRYLDSAAQQGEPFALGYLGRLNENGALGEPNHPHAAILYYLAALQGHPEAKQWGCDLLNRMPAEMQQEAARRINLVKDRFEREAAGRTSGFERN